jgi:hypothetical protein
MTRGCKVTLYTANKKWVIAQQREDEELSSFFSQKLANTVFFVLYALTRNHYLIDAPTSTRGAHAELAAACKLAGVSPLPTASVPESASEPPVKKKKSASGAAVSAFRADQLWNHLLELAQNEKLVNAYCRVIHYTFKKLNLDFSSEIIKKVLSLDDAVLNEIANDKEINFAPNCFDEAVKCEYLKEAYRLQMAVKPESIKNKDLSEPVLLEAKIIRLNNFERLSLAIFRPYAASSAPPFDLVFNFDEVTIIPSIFARCPGVYIISPLSKNPAYGYLKKGDCEYFPVVVKMSLQKSAVIEYKNASNASGVIEGEAASVGAGSDKQQLSISTTLMIRDRDYDELRASGANYHPNARDFFNLGDNNRLYLSMPRQTGTFFINLPTNAFKTLRGELEKDEEFPQGVDLYEQGEFLNNNFFNLLGWIGENELLDMITKKYFSDFRNQGQMVWEKFVDELPNGKLPPSDNPTIDMVLEGLVPNMDLNKIAPLSFISMHEQLERYKKRNLDEQKKQLRKGAYSVRENKLSMENFGFALTFFVF